MYFHGNERRHTWYWSIIVLQVGVEGLAAREDTGRWAVVPQALSVTWTLTCLGNINPAIGRKSNEKERIGEVEKKESQPYDSRRWAEMFNRTDKCICYSHYRWRKWSSEDVHILHKSDCPAYIGFIIKMRHTVEKFVNHDSWHMSFTCIHISHGLVDHCVRLYVS